MPSFESARGSVPLEKSVERTLSGWGRYPRSRAHVYRPEKIRAACRILRCGGRDSYLGRGLGRSYGDAALNRGGGIILSERLNRFLSFDASRGLLRAEAGVSLEEVIQVFLPRGWFLPVTPGTRFVTLGGAVASDVHGKNHHRDGSFSNFVEEIKILTARREVVSASRRESPELFRATLGGMGLTGLVLEVSLRLMPVETAYVRALFRRTRDLEETLSLMEEEDRHHRYSVAWVDLLARGGRRGRGVLIRGDHALRSELARGRPPLRAPARHPWRLPFSPPAVLLKRSAAQAFNSFYYRQFSREPQPQVVDIERFFFPLDRLLEWNRIYGRRGFVQYQCVLPLRNSHEGLVDLITRLEQSCLPSFLSVLKRFGKGEGLLSFPMEGYTLTLDLPMLGQGVRQLLGRLDERVVHYGGRVYLAKDACLSPELLPAMYPALEEWRQIRNRLDPELIFSSDLARRLHLDGGGS